MLIKLYSSFPTMENNTLNQLAYNIMKLLPTAQLPLSAEQFTRNPEVLVNKIIEHLLDTDQGLQWFRGTVVGYSEDSKEYGVLYDSEDSEYFYPLLEDIANGEVIVYDFLIFVTMS